MADSSTNLMILKGAGLISLVLSAAYIIRSEFTTETAPVCSARYQQSLQFSLKSQSGKLMTAEELESRAGAASFGFRENATAVSVEGGPVNAAINVRLEKGTGSPYQDRVTPGGISYRWSPNQLLNAGAACLTYHVWFPDTFDFGSGGTLPGLFGGANYNPKEHANGFGEHVNWSYEGAGEIGAMVPNLQEHREAARDKGGEISVAIPVPDTDKTIPIGRESFWFRKGRWASLEQEVVLNEPGKSNGLLRLWVDGALVIENPAMNWRNEKETRLGGVLFDASYGSVDSTGAAPADAALRVGGLTIRWK